MKKSMRYFLFLISFFCGLILKSQNTITGNYAGNIPTSFSSYDEGCNGPSAELSITLPLGESYQITGINISYNMTAIGEGFKLDQRSKIRCVNTGIEEPEYSGIGATTGVQSYNRTGVGIANGIYPGGTVFTFQFWGRRTYESVPGCNQSSNYASNLSITIVYGNQIVVSKAGVNRTNPVNTLDVNGKLRLGDDSSTPTAGSIRWNAANHDFEGFDGNCWVSFTRSNTDAKFGKTLVEPDKMYFFECGFVNSSVDLNWLIISCAVGNIAGGTDDDSGYITPYYKSGQDWLPQSKIAPPDNMPGNFFGYDVAVSANELLVSAVGANSNSGKVYYYHYNGLFWALMGSFTPPDITVGDQFGSKIVIDRNRAYISSPLKSIAGNAAAGKVYVYFFNGTSWVLESEITAPVPAINDEFGHAIDAAWPHLIIGCPNKDHSGYIDNGQAYLMKNVSSNWYLLNTLLDVTGNDNDAYGFAVSITQNDLAISAPNKSLGGLDDAGMIQTFHRTNNTWNVSGNIMSTMGNSGIGYSLDLSENFLASGNPDSFQTGNAALYKKVNNSDWEQVQIIKNLTADNLELSFGMDLTINNNQLFVLSIYSISIIDLSN